MSKFLPGLRSITSKVAGFTMIELLIVITILGILATAVLSAINPLEQINRGRDTATQSDAEQLINAVERFTAFQEYLPWLEDRTVSTDTFGAVPLTIVGSTWFTTDDTGADTSCEVLDRIGTNDGGTCTSGANEVKESYAEKLRNLALNPERALYIYKENGSTASNVYVCFQPQSEAFRTKATERCGATFSGTNLPGDLVPNETAWDALCGECDANGADCYSCLP
jgi:prepilin-type N-terminal cleavage/methylation domain-containing protein